MLNSPLLEAQRKARLADVSKLRRQPHLSQLVLHRISVVTESTERSSGLCVARLRWMGHSDLI
jgi:hypothetical protein